MWNVRNLSATLTRGKSKPWDPYLDERIRSIMDAVKTVKPDIVLLLETGDDADTRISKWFPSGYTFRVSRVSGKQNIDNNQMSTGETYVIAWKRNVQDKKQLTIETDQEPNGRVKVVVDAAHPNEYRGAAYLRCRFANSRKFVIAVLHAPSPSHPVQLRQEVIRGILKSLKDQFKGHTLLLCGDLNFKANEQERLKDALPSSFKHRGPFLEDDSTPEATSRRKFKTVLVQGESDSQPYDQVWSQGNALSVHAWTPDYQDVTPTDPERSLARLQKLIEKLVIDTDEEFAKGVGPRPNGVHPKILQDYREQSDLLEKTATRVDVPGRRARDRRLLEILDRARDLLPPIQEKATLPQNPDQRDYAVRVAYLRDSLEKLRIVLGYIEAPDIQRLAAMYELGISDHLPVLFCIRPATAGAVPAPRT